MIPIETACPGCDLLATIPPLRTGELATCVRCGQQLTAAREDPLTRSLAMALAAILLLILASSFPFLELRASGLEARMTLPSSAAQLHRDGYTAVAAIALTTMVLFPAGMLATIVAMAYGLSRGGRSPWLVAAARAFFWMRSWSMVEVFVIGVIVSLVKIGQMATVILGISFWSYVAFGLCFTAAVASVDRVQLWERIEEATA